MANQQGGVEPKDNPNLAHVADFEAGELYEGVSDEEDDDADELYDGVTDDAEVSDSSDYRMITKSDDTVSSQGS